MIAAVRDVMAFALLGGLVGLAYFAALRHAVGYGIVTGRIGWALALGLARFAGASVAFGLIAQAGSVPLIVALMGFLVARFGVVRAARTRP